MNKHYIRLDGTSIVKGFSDAFEEAMETDICVNEEGGRHYNPPITDFNGAPLNKYVDGVIIPTTEEERALYIPEPEPDYDAELAEKIKASTTLEELKTALTSGMAKVKAKK